MKSRGMELYYAVLAIAAITAAYVLASMRRGGVPLSSDPLGEILGASGFVLMLSTETLYSLRKHSRYGARWGSMQSWLKFHIFTGLVGPYMVLLHSAGRFHGLAGVVALFTVAVVASGFIGRYIYTSLPRGSGGTELNDKDLESRNMAVESELRAWLASHPRVREALPDDIVNPPDLPFNTLRMLLARPFSDWRYRWRWWRVRRRLRGAGVDSAGELGEILYRRREVRYQIAGLVLMRRMLALWHTVHVPLGITLFSLAFIHIGVALYYAAFAR